MSVTLCSSNTISKHNNDPYSIVSSCTPSKSLLKMNNDSIIANRTDKSSQTWIMKKLDDLNPSLVLENNASVARDHLAGSSDSHKDDKVGKGLGIAFIVLGIIFLGFGLFRYFNSQQLMTKGRFPASRGSVVLGLRDFSPFDAFKNVQDISKPVQQHLLKVYLTLSTVCLVTAAGAYAHTHNLFLFNGGLLSIMLGLASLIGIMCTPDTPNNKTLRYGLLYNFAFMEGLSIGPLMEITLMISHSYHIIVNACILTFLIFGSFTLGALLSNKRSYIYLGGILGSAISMLFWMSIINTFVGSVALFSAELYIGLGIFCLYVIYDTQLIIYRATQHHSRDVVSHTLDLFIDLIGIFTRLVVLMTNSERKTDNRRRKNTRTGTSYVGL
ncbi:3683_t:CDS:2 [Cetraspora pellucida]|uniref:3683_t:CDS:1 n=1 Tax=Cetraspora pellucida TaxID=1433469 RepID=A0A9N9B4F1_9GLOM|nr:3683_t:CDS:2 [Cetraspora pellucida]